LSVVGAADDLVAEGYRQLGRRDLAVAQVKVGAADRARADREPQLPGLWFRVGERGELQGLALALQDDRSQLPASPQ